MKFESKFDIDDIVFVKDSRGGVKKGKVCAIGINTAKHVGKDFAVIYLIWISDRLDGAGHHERAYEQNIGDSFDAAYYHSDCMMPWNIMDDVKQKDFKNFFDDNPCA